MLFYWAAQGNPQAAVIVGFILWVICDTIQQEIWKDNNTNIVVKIEILLV